MSTTAQDEAGGIIISHANEHFDLLMVLDVKSVALHSILILPEGKPNFKATHLLLTEMLDLYMVQEKKNNWGNNPIHCVCELGGFEISFTDRACAAKVVINFTLAIVKFSPYNVTSVVHTNIYLNQTE